MIYYIFLFLFLLTSCKYNGTETGNPIPASEALNNSRIYKIVEATCDRLMECQTPPLDDAQIAEQKQACVSEQMRVSDYAVKLGLPTEYQTSSLLELIYSEYEGELVPDEPTKIRCINDIMQLSCSDVAIQQTLSDPYKFVSEILQPSCSEVF